MKRIFFILLTFFMLLGLISIPLLYSLAKLVRSKQHFSNALAFKEAGDDKNALFKLLSARNLDPDNPEILRLAGPYGAADNSPYTLEMWTEAANLGLLDLGSVLDMIEYGLRTGQVDRVRPYLYQVARENPGNPRIQSYQLRLLRGDRKTQESRNLARSLVKEGNFDLDIFSAYVQATFTDLYVPEEEQEEAMAKLREAAREPDEVGIFSLRALVTLQERLEEDERARIAEQLRSHPQAELADFLRLLSLEKAEGADEEAILAQARVDFDRIMETHKAGGDPESQPRAISLFCDWLNHEEYSETVLEYLPDPAEVKNPAAFFSRQIALIQTGAAGKARDASFLDNPLSTTQNLVSRALAQFKLNEIEKAKLSLSQAVKSAQLNEVIWLEKVLRMFGEFDLVISMYESLERRLSNPLAVQLRILNYYYGLGREEDVQRVAKAIPLDSLRGALAEELSVLYFCLLYRQDLPGVRRHIEGMISQYPSLIEPRIFLAFSYALSGDPALALALIEGWEEFGLERNRTFAIMLAAIYARNNKVERARELVGSIRQDSLMDQERVLLNSVI